LVYNLTINLTQLGVCLDNELSHPWRYGMRELVDEIARALVDHPDGVNVAAVQGAEVTVFELRVHPEDLGKVIGRQGRTVKAMRTLLAAAGMKVRRRFSLVILED
jgi:uncharacterized protein